MVQINQSINRPINQSINQSIEQSINQSIDQSINRSINWIVSQSINQSNEGIENAQCNTPVVWLMRLDPENTESLSSSSTIRDCKGTCIRRGQVENELCMDTGLMERRDGGPLRWPRPITGAARRSVKWSSPSTLVSTSISSGTRRCVEGAMYCGIMAFVSCGSGNPADWRRWRVDLAGCSKRGWTERRLRRSSRLVSPLVVSESARLPVRKRLLRRKSRELKDGVRMSSPRFLRWYSQCSRAVFHKCRHASLVS